MIAIRLTAIACAVAFAVGAATGAFGVYLVFDHARLSRALTEARSELQRYQRAIGINEDIVSEAVKVQLSNEEITNAIIQKARNFPADDHDCVDADSMSAIARLR